MFGKKGKCDICSLTWDLEDGQKPVLVEGLVLCGFHRSVIEKGLKVDAYMAAAKQDMENHATAFMAKATAELSQHAEDAKKKIMEAKAKAAEEARGMAEQFDRDRKAFQKEMQEAREGRDKLRAGLERISRFEVSMKEHAGMLAGYDQRMSAMSGRMDAMNEGMDEINESFEIMKANTPTFATADRDEAMARFIASQESGASFSLLMREFSFSAPIVDRSLKRLMAAGRVLKRGKNYVFAK